MKTLRILIVESRHETADIFALWVTSEGHDVKVCNSGHQAEETLRDYQPDLILLSIGLPDMDGWELAPLIRSQHPSAKIVAITAPQSACQFTMDRQRSFDAGFDLHLRKPLLREQVMRLLATV